MLLLEKSIIHDVHHLMLMTQFIVYGTIPDNLLSIVYKNKGKLFYNIISYHHNPQYLSIYLTLYEYKRFDPANVRSTLKILLKV